MTINSVLTLNLKEEYFNQIKDGSKKFEYRPFNHYWKKRILNREYETISIRLGYPKKKDSERIIERPWMGWEIKTILHEHFGDEPVKVFAIRVNP